MVQILNVRIQFNIQELEAGDTLSSGLAWSM